MQWLSLFILTIGCMMQRVNWSDDKAEMDHENQISDTPLNVSQNKKHNTSIWDHIINRTELVWILLQVIFCKI